jgi:general secretion pathway protein L
MSESVVARQAARLRMAYAASPLSRFFTWWGGELAGLLPARVRKLLAERRDEVLLGLAPDAVRIERRGRHPMAEASIPREGDVAALRAAIAQRVEGHEDPPQVLLCLPPERVLLRQLSLPQAAESNLRQVLAFEMDRQTPFRADQVHYDCRVLSRDEATRTMVVELALVPRAAIDPDLAALAETGVALDGIDVRAPDAPRSGFNLLPPERRAVRRNLWLQIDFALAGVVVVLLLLVMAQSVGNRAIALEGLRARTESEREQARGVAALRTELKTAIEGANFLAERKRARPPISDILLDITGRLGNDTWLQRFSLNGDQLQLQGQSREAAGLITVLQQSPYLEAPALQGAITPDARTGKEQFLIQAKARAVVVAPAAAPAAEPASPDSTSTALPTLAPEPTPAPAPAPATETDDAAAPRS